MCECPEELAADHFLFFTQVELLVWAGVDVKLADRRGRTPLGDAERVGATQIVELLRPLVDGSGVTVSGVGATQIVELLRPLVDGSSVAVSGEWCFGWCHGEW